MTKTPQKIRHTSIYRFLKNIYFSFFLFFFKKLIMDYASQCSEMYNKREKNKKKKKDQNPPKKFGILVYVDFLKIYIFLFFFFFKETHHGLCITVFRNVQQKG